MVGRYAYYSHSRPEEWHQFLWGFPDKLVCPFCGLVQIVPSGDLAGVYAVLESLWATSVCPVKLRRKLERQRRDLEEAEERAAFQRHMVEKYGPRGVPDVR